MPYYCVSVARVWAEPGFIYIEAENEKQALSLGLNRANQNDEDVEWLEECTEYAVEADEVTLAPGEKPADGENTPSMGDMVDDDDDDENITFR